MRVAIASDHGGFTLKEHLKGILAREGHLTEDFGTDQETSVDYPEYAARLTDSLRTGRNDLGILVCGTGIGMSIAANRVPGIRAALCTNAFMAEMSRAHNDANVLCLGGRLLSEAEAEEILLKWLSTSYENGRHERRLTQIPHGRG